MNEARAVLTCEWCGKLYDPHDEKWLDRTTEAGISFFEHKCDRYTVAFTYPDTATYRYKNLADRVRAAFERAMR